MMHGCKAGSFRELTRVFRDGTLAGSSDRVFLQRPVRDSGMMMLPSRPCWYAMDH